MSIEIKLHDPPVTFGMLPVGTRYRPTPDGAWWFKTKHISQDHRNCICEDGEYGLQADEDDAFCVEIPPGTTLAKPQAKMLNAEDAEAPFLLDGELYRFVRMTSAAMADVKRWPDGLECREVRYDTLVQPCRVEVHVWPEVEA